MYTFIQVDVCTIFTQDIGIQYLHKVDIVQNLVGNSPILEKIGWKIPCRWEDVKKSHY
jgi:hypothetical protein